MSELELVMGFICGDNIQTWVFDVNLAQNNTVNHLSIKFVLIQVKPNCLLKMLTQHTLHSSDEVDE